MSSLYIKRGSLPEDSVGGCDDLPIFLGQKPKKPILTQDFPIPAKSINLKLRVKNE
jgi:hypothetical protein